MTLSLVDRTIRRKISKKKYRQSHKGTDVEKRYQAKRRRKYGWIKMVTSPFPEDLCVHDHHNCDAFVFTIPKRLHQLANCGTDKEKHREQLRPWLELFYPDSELWYYQQLYKE